jgi:hypothetical protein
MNQASSNSEWSSFSPIPYSIPVQAIIETQETEGKAAASDEEHVKLQINGAEAETENTLSDYQKKVKEKEDEFAKLFEEVKNSVASVKENQEKIAKIEKEKAFFKVCHVQISRKSKVQE